MFNENVNIPKGPINVVTSTTTSIIYDPQNNVTTIDIQLINNFTK
jgi:hypothetical protein